jgi:hypothetical protein
MFISLDVKNISTIIAKSIRNSLIIKEAKFHILCEQTRLRGVKFGRGISMIYFTSIFVDELCLKWISILC